MIGSILSFVAYGLLVILAVILIIKMAEIRAYQIKEEERESSPVKEGDIFVLEDEDLKSYNVCFFVEQVYEGYYAGTMYSLTGGKKRKCDLISITVLYRKGINYAGLYEFRDISFTDEEIKRVGFKRV